jgi:hypothetical protein
MTKKNLGEGLDPGLFEYEPKEVSDEDMLRCLADTDTDPEDIKNPVRKAQYIEYLKTYQRDEE